MSDTIKPGWVERLVATWCEHRANGLSPLIKRCRTAYKKGPMVIIAHIKSYREATK